MCAGASDARIERLLQAHLAGGGSVRVALATDVRLTARGKITPADFAQRHVRHMADGAALLSPREDEVAIDLCLDAAEGEG